MRQQLELVSELQSDLWDAVDWGKKWLVDFNIGKTQLVSFVLSCLGFVHQIRCWLHIKIKIKIKCPAGQNLETMTLRHLKTYVLDKFFKNYINCFYFWRVLLVITNPTLYDYSTLSPHIHLPPHSFWENWHDHKKSWGFIRFQLPPPPYWSYFKRLGLTFFSKLVWGSYIIFIAKTVSKKIGVLIHSMKSLSSELALYLYKSTIYPCMEYWRCIWAGAPGCYLEVLDKL